MKHLEWVIEMLHKRRETLEYMITEKRYKRKWQELKQKIAQTKYAERILKHHEETH